MSVCVCVFRDLSNSFKPQLKEFLPKTVELVFLYIVYYYYYDDDDYDDDDDDYYYYYHCCCLFMY